MLGDTNFYGSTISLGQNVNRAQSATTVTASANSSLLGAAMTLTAVISAVAPGSGVPTGTITFTDGTKNLGTIALSSGQAALSLSTLSVGSHSIIGQYSGDADFIPSSGSVAVQIDYNICALYDQTKSVQSGATVPIKLYLCNVSNGDVSSPLIALHAVQVVGVSGNSGGLESPGNSNPDGDFLFDSTLGVSGGYHFNLKTSGLLSGTYTLTFTATNDPIPHSVNFGVK